MFVHVSVAFAITSLVCIAVLLSGSVNLAAATIFVSLPFFVWLAFGRVWAGPTGLACALSLTGLLILQGLSVLPPENDAAALVLTVLATLLATANLIAAGLLVWRVYQQNQSAAAPEPAPAPLLNLPEDGGVLLIETTPLGRVRHVSGQTDWAPELGSGAVLDRALRTRDGETLKDGIATLPTGTVVRVRHSVGADGEQWILTQADQSGNADAQAELLARTTFFAGLGHDLKSPLNSVIGFAEMMDDEVLGPMPEPYRDYPGLIRQAGATLLRLVEDMLSYARSEAGTFEIDPEPLDIAAIGEAILRQSEASAALTGVTLQFKARGAVMAQADASAVHRIWDNLVSNAIKYSDEGGIVRLSAVVRGDTVSLSVTDHGAGMDAADLARIAKPFEQGQNAKGRAGTGLGLAMVHRLAEMHSGKVVIRTALGEGTHIVVSLPAANVADKRDAAE
ncbi:MAG: HAMP domain-containing sensor histidine kinase [Pseudomonadota bacterium]